MEWTRKWVDRDSKAGRYLLEKGIDPSRITMEIETKPYLDPWEYWPFTVLETDGFTALPDVWV